jgi:2-dehydro-3-deoxyphosphooctonate aldolase (KDO 8-P synthase)
MCISCIIPYFYDENIYRSTSSTIRSVFLLAGPCAIEGEEMASAYCRTHCKTYNKLNIPFVFKGSFKKANRSRVDSFTGIGDEKALKILRKVGETFEVPTVTDIHEVSDAEKQLNM